MDFMPVYAPGNYAINDWKNLEEANAESRNGRCKEGKVRRMENFVLAGKAKTVFRLLELKAKREEMARKDKKRHPKNKRG